MFALSGTSDKSFLEQNALWICLGIAGFILLVLITVAVILIVRKKKAPKAKPVSKETVSVYIAALGGQDNIVSHELVRSRIVLELRDYSLVDKEKLKEAGVDGFIMMSNKLTLVIQGNAEAVNRAIFEAD